jgi:hypothetical protein
MTAIAAEQPFIAVKRQTVPDTLSSRPIFFNPVIALGRLIAAQTLR